MKTYKVGAAVFSQKTKKTVESISFERTLDTDSNRDCYKDASDILITLGRTDRFALLTSCGVLLGDASKSLKCRASNMLEWNSEMYNFCVSISCFEV